MIRAAKPAAVKVDIANDLEDVVKRARSILLADFTGMSVAQCDKLRLECFNNNITFRVAKNTIAKMVFERSGITGVGDILTGPTGFCVGFDDPIIPVKILADFVRENDKPAIKGCLVEGKFYGPEKVDELKTIPPREVMLAMVVGAIASPLSGLVYVFNEILRSFVGVVDALGKKIEDDQSEREGLSATGGSVESIIESIEKMTVLELVELKKALEEKFGVTAAMPMAMAGAVAGPAAEAAEEVEEQTEFTVMLTSAGDKKIQVIKEVRAITSLGLKEAKALVDEAPKPVKEGISKEEAMAIKAKIEEAGGQVELK